MKRVFLHSSVEAAEIIIQCLLVGDVPVELKMIVHANLVGAFQLMAALIAQLHCIRVFGVCLSFASRHQLPKPRPVERSYRVCFLNIFILGLLQQEPTSECLLHVLAGLVRFQTGNEFIFSLLLPIQICVCFIVGNVPPESVLDHGFDQHAVVTLAHVGLVVA